MVPGAQRRSTTRRSPGRGPDRGKLAKSAVVHGRECAPIPALRAGSPAPPYIAMLAPGLVVDRLSVRFSATAPTSDHAMRCQSATTTTALSTIAQSTAICTLAGAPALVLLQPERDDAHPAQARPVPEEHQKPAPINRPPITAAYAGSSSARRIASGCHSVIAESRATAAKVLTVKRRPMRVQASQ